MHCIEGVLPAGETFARVLGDIEGAGNLTCVSLEGEVLAVSVYYEPGGGYAVTVVADGGELDGCAYRDIAGEELVTVTVDKDASRSLVRVKLSGVSLVCLVIRGFPFRYFEVL